MFREIVWVLFVEAHSEAEAKKVLGKFTEAIGKKVNILNFEPYWKDETLFSVTATSPLNADDVATALFETLQTCSKVAIRWVIKVPSEQGKNKWEFHGSEHPMTGILVPGIHAISFHVDNFDD